MEMWQRFGTAFTSPNPLARGENHHPVFSKLKCNCNKDLKTSKISPWWKENPKSLALKFTSSPAFIHNIMYVQFEHQRIIQSLLLSALKLEEWVPSIYSNFLREVLEVNFPPYCLNLKCGNLNYKKGQIIVQLAVALDKLVLSFSSIPLDFCSIKYLKLKHFISGKNSNKTHSYALESDKIEQ